MKCAHGCKPRTSNRHCRDRLCSEFEVFEPYMHILLHAQMRTCIQLGWSHPGNPTQRGVVTEGLQARSQHKVSHMVSPQGSPRDAPQLLPIRFRQGTGTLCIYTQYMYIYVYRYTILYIYIYIFPGPGFTSHIHQI